MKRSLSKSQKKRCLDIMDAIERFEISSIFSQPVDTSFYPRYTEIIEKPMDLGTVREKLKKDKYSTLSQWDSDMRLIWQNAQTFNAGITDPYNMCARQLEQEYLELYSKLSENQEKDWMQELNSIDKSIHKIKKRIEKIVEGKSGKESSHSSKHDKEDSESRHEKKQISNKVESDVEYKEKEEEYVVNEEPPKVEVRPEPVEVPEPVEEEPEEEVVSQSPPPPPVYLTDRDGGRKLSKGCLNNICKAYFKSQEAYNILYAELQPDGDEEIKISDLSLKTQLSLAESLNIPVVYE